MDEESRRKVEYFLRNFNPIYKIGGVTPVDLVPRHYTDQGKVYRGSQIGFGDIYSQTR